MRMLVMESIEASVERVWEYYILRETAHVMNLIWTYRNLDPELISIHLEPEQYRKVA